MEKKLYRIVIYFGPNEVYEDMMRFGSYTAATAYAWTLCEEIYENYEGKNGILSYEDVAADLCDSWKDKPTEEEIWLAYQDEIAGWMHYEITHIPTTSYKDIIS